MIYECECCGRRFPLFLPVTLPLPAPSLCPECLESANRTAPDRTAPQFVHSPQNSQNQHAKEAQVVEMSKTEGGVAGSNPAGVATSTPRNDTGYCPSPELSAVETHKNPSGLPPKGTPDPVPGDVVEVCVFADGSDSVERWERCRVDTTFPGSHPFTFQVVRGGVLQTLYAWGAGASWRWPAQSPPAGRCAAAVADPLSDRGTNVCGQLLPCMDHHAVLAAPVPEVRRCGVLVPVHHGDGLPDTQEACGAVLGRELDCCICGAASCYPHCGCIDHLHGAMTLSVGGSGRLSWRLVATHRGDGERVYCGQLYSDDPGGRVILHSFIGRDSDEVLGRIIGEADRLLEPTPAQRDYAAPVANSLIERGLEVANALSELSRQVGLRIEDRKYASNRTRAKVLDAVVAWLAETEIAWDETFDDPTNNPRVVEACRQLRNRQLVDLFSRIGGAL